MTQAPDQVSGPTHGCVRCGAPIPIDDGMCERCNPLGLKQPAPSQAHGTVVIAVGPETTALESSVATWWVSVRSASANDSVPDVGPPGVSGPPGVVLPPVNAMC